MSIKIDQETRNHSVNRMMNRAFEKAEDHARWQAYMETGESLDASEMDRVFDDLLARIKD